MSRKKDLMRNRFLQPCWSEDLELTRTNVQHTLFTRLPLFVFLHLVALARAFTTMATAGFTQTDNSMFWDSPGAQQDLTFMAPTTTKSPVFPMYNSIQTNQQTGSGNQQAMMDEFFRLALQNDMRPNTTSNQPSSQIIKNQPPGVSPWLPVINNNVARVQDANAQMNMIKLQNVMKGGNQQQNGISLQSSSGQQQDLSSVYQVLLQQMNMQQTAGTTTTTTSTPVTPSPTISAFTPPPSMYGVGNGQAHSPYKTIAEIIQEKMNRLNGTNKTTKPPTSKGCYYKKMWYSPLTEISKGQSGDWCYGTYCNHEGVVVHWDDHRCIQNIQETTPLFTAPPTTVVNPELGCFYKGRWYDPGQDILNSRNMDTCYGSYCDYNSKVVHWEDKCYATVPPPGGMGGMGGLSGMSGMDGMAGMAALAGMGGMGGNGMTGAGMYGMGGMGGQPGGAAATLDLLRK